MNAVNDLHQALRPPARGMAPAAVLAQPVDRLVGVGSDAVEALAAVGIHTVLDLGASALFGLAQRVASLADGDAGALSATPLPADLLDDAARGRTASEVAAGGLGQLRMLNATQARSLGRALAALCVRDLGLWPPALAARRLVQLAMGSTDPAADPAAPEELQPRMGQLPVDRVVYPQLYFECLLADLAATLGVDDAKDDGPAEAPMEDASKAAAKAPFGSHMMPAPGMKLDGLGEMPLDLTPAVLGRGFEAPGLGLRVSIAQTWTPVGLSLGQLLHSVALAPGEATRVAMVDWSRRVTTSTKEEITEDEALENTLSRNRAVSEITSAVAKETQEGRSRFNTTGASWGLGAGAAGEYKGVAAAVNFGYSRTDANGSAFSSSSGMRDISGSASQNVQDSTEQNASLSRGRRASVVSEVGTREAETLTTRVVANYNHMHALSVLYFEVVQLYRTRTEVVDVEPLLYLPVQPFDFSNDTLVERYRGLLAEVALNTAARDALLGIVKPDTAAGQGGKGVPGVATLVLDGRFLQPPYLANTPLDAAGLRLALGEHASFDGATLKLRSDEAAFTEVQVSGVYNKEGKLLDQAYDSIELQGEGSPGDLPVTRWAPVRADQNKEPPEGFSEHPFRALLGNAWGELGSWKTLRGRRAAGNVGDTSCFVQFLVRRRDKQGQPAGDPVRFIYQRTFTSAEKEQRLAVCDFVPDVKPKEPAVTAPPFDLPAHLRANALHYTMALLRRADPGMLGMVLGRLKLLGRPLLSQVDAVPVAHAGNYLVFRWRLLADTPEWQNLLKRRGLTLEQRQAAVREALVPVASGGVFAEAVLGRFNSAEKLDLTRFWNWQDSTIPLVPTEIAPLQAGIRQGAQALVPTTLGPANLRQQDAPAAPDPGVAMSGILTAVTRADTFRNMAGLEKLLEQGGQAMTLSAQGAREFMAKAMETVSAYGARVNHGRDMDERAKQANAAPAAGQVTGGQGTGGNAGGSGSQSGASGAGGANSKPAAPSGHEAGAFSGPGTPAPEGGAAAAPTERSFSQAIAVEVRTDVPRGGAFLQGTPLLVEGIVRLSQMPVDKTPLTVPGGEPFVPPDALKGLVSIPVSGGSGSTSVKLTVEGSGALTPALTLYVGKLRTLGFTFTGPPIPGAPDFVEQIEENWAYANPVRVPMPAVATSGADLRLGIAMRVEDRIAAEREHATRDNLDAFFELTRRSVSIPLAGLVDGQPLDSERLDKLKQRVAEALDMGSIRKDIESTFNVFGTTRDYQVVLGCEMRYSAAGNTIEASFPWVSVADCRVVTVSA